MTWSIRDLADDTIAGVIAFWAPVLTPLLDAIYPPLTHDLDRPVDGAEVLADKEAEEEVSEPEFDAMWANATPVETGTRGNSDGYNITVKDGVPYQLGVDVKLGPQHCGFCGGRFPDGCECGVANPTEPALTADELVAVRGLIQERYDPPCNLCGLTSGLDAAGIMPRCKWCNGGLRIPNFAGAAASLADGGTLGVSSSHTPSVREDKQQPASPADPQSIFRSGGQTFCMWCNATQPGPHTATCPKTPAVVPGPPSTAASPSEGHPPEPSEGHPDLAAWLQPAVATILDQHRRTNNRVIDGALYCCDSEGIHDEYGSEAAWLDHASAAVAAHVAQALPDYPRPQATDAPPLTPTVFEIAEWTADAARFIGGLSEDVAGKVAASVALRVVDAIKQQNPN